MKLWRVVVGRWKKWRRLRRWRRAETEMAATEWALAGLVARFAATRDGAVARGLATEDLDELYVREASGLIGHWQACAAEMRPLDPGGEGVDQ